MKLGQAKRRIGKIVYFLGRGLTSCRLIEVKYDDGTEVWMGIVLVGETIEMEIPINKLIP